MTADDRQSEHLRELGLQAGADWEATQSRYRQLVLAHHPDLHPGDAACAERFRKVAAAYEALSLLRRERSASSPEGLDRMRDDPRLRSLSAEELGLRLRYSSSPWVRAAAAGLMGESAGSRRLLRTALKDPEPLVRSSALEALSRAGKPGDLLGILCSPLARRGVSAGQLLRASTLIWRRAIASGLRAGWRAADKSGGKQ
jgi:hypothetical protein